MKPIFYLTMLAVLCSLVPAAVGAKNKRLQLNIIRHQPCVSRVQPNERIRFSSIDKAPLVPDRAKGDGCYTINGPVQIRKGISGTVQVYVQAKSGSKAPIEKCTKPDKYNCGGVGSCIYCDVCSTRRQLQRQTSASVTVEEGGKPLDCKNGLTAGTYNDIRISFCLPTKQEFLDAEGIDDDIWNQRGAGGHTFFLTIYVFNKAVNNLSSSQLKRIATDNSDQIIGCHRLVGNVYEAD